MSKFSFSKSMSEILKHPSAIAALVGILIIIIVILKINKIKFTTKLVAQIGIVLALSTVLSFFKIYRLPQGGSVTLGSMVPILLIAFFYGPEVGFLTGFLFGIIDLILEPYILHPVQVLFDYPLPYMALGAAGYFKNKKILGTIIAVFMRFIFHVISGVVFFASDVPKGQTPLMYSIIYNGSFLSIDCIICLIIIGIIPLKRLYRIVNSGN
ncbi:MULTISPECIES: energy-coupled thiamine transporter ThiT [Clostridium]|uniref:energy-coupled thiamine transporter ThiT n=1 Tax=Clostridium TaxID=1485 RepID=UPI0008254AA3|nr:MULTISPECIES: energy-coupled thiamine transporter ThiT [Clostridium]PJI09095.1 energy-coupled thiamine transporter ThiT [Clostridium sp. CT7]